MQCFNDTNNGAYLILQMEYLYTETDVASYVALAQNSGRGKLQQNIHFLQIFYPDSVKC